MKYKFLWIILFITAFMLQGCLSPKFNIGDSINAPENESIPIKGTWKLSEPIYSSSSDEVNKKASQGDTAQFTKDTAIIDSDICKNPNYKIKVVNTDDYFLYTYKIVSQDLNIKTNKIDVITITCNDKLFYELVKISDTKLLINIDGTFYYLDKISDKTNIKELDDDSTKDSGQDIEENSSSDSGVLLGIKEVSDDITKTPSKYRTLWIEFHDNKLYPVFQSNNLFLPRKSGFWEVKSVREHINDFVQDKFYASPIDVHINKKSNTKNSNENLSESSFDIVDMSQILFGQYNEDLYNSLTNVYANINFVGNDYLCSEYTTNSDVKSNKLEKLKVLPIDNLENTEGLTITNIIGKNGYKVFEDSLKSFLSSHSKEDLEGLNLTPSEDNITLSRKNGHWIMEGRLNSTDEFNSDNFKNFTINIFPPKKMVSFDELYVSWNDVKSEVPSATDVFTSPNKDIALIISPNKIYIYSIKYNHLSGTPLKEISLKENESIVMAEWATGSYVENWSDAFKYYIKVSY